MMWEWNNWGGWWAGMIVVMGVVWVVIVGLVVWIIVRITGSGSGRHSSGKNTPLDIIRERYAKGEITKEEFERLKRDLTG